MRHTTCKCGAIEWAITHKNAKPIPIDVGTNPKGNLVVVTSAVDGTKTVRTLTKAELEPALFGGEGPRYMPHHATCPKVAQFRRPNLRVRSPRATRPPTS